MNKVLENIKRKITFRTAEAKAYRENIMVISVTELKDILETEFAKHNNGWIPVTERLPENNQNVRVTCVNCNGDLELGYGWYNRFTESWCVCTDDDNVMYSSNKILAWKENTDEPYQPEGGVPE